MEMDEPGDPKEPGEPGEPALVEADRVRAIMALTAHKMLVAQLLAEQARASDDPAAFLRRIEGRTMRALDRFAFHDVGPFDAEFVKHGTISEVELLLAAAEKLAAAD